MAVYQSRSYKKYTWQTEPPTESIKPCLATIIPKGTTKHVVIDGWSGDNKIIYDGIAWQDYPEPFSRENTNGWKSIHLGDDEPKPNTYLLTITKMNGTRSRVVMRYYDSNRIQLAPGEDVIAWRDVPSPYGGKM